VCRRRRHRPSCRARAGRVGMILAPRPDVGQADPTDSPHSGGEAGSRAPPWREPPVRRRRPSACPPQSTGLHRSPPSSDTRADLLLMARIRGAATHGLALRRVRFAGVSADLRRPAPNPRMGVATKPRRTNTQRFRWVAPHGFESKCARGVHVMHTQPEITSPLPSTTHPSVVPTAFISQVLEFV